MEELAQRGIQIHLRRVAGSYLRQRETEKIKRNVKKVAAGVPQGSVLGPTLSNILYHEVLRLQMGRNIHLVTYTDDLAIVARSTTEKALNDTVNDKLMSINELILVPEKTVNVVLTGMRRPKDIHFEMRGLGINPK